MPTLCAELVRQGLVAAGPLSDDLHGRVVGQVERELIQQVLASCDGVQITAAARLRINRNTLRKKIAEFKIDGAGEPPPAASSPVGDEESVELDPPPSPED